MKAAPPLQWLGAILLLWAGGRAAMLWPDGARLPDAARPTIAAAPETRPVGLHERRRASSIRQARKTEVHIGLPENRRPSSRSWPSQARTGPPDPIALPGGLAPPSTSSEAHRTARYLDVPGLGRAPYAAMAENDLRRWQGEAYIFLRKGEGGDPTLAPGGTLGGGQVFARLRYRLDEAGRWAASVRASRARDDGAGEAAVGLRYAPLPQANVAVERRVALERGGRDAWALIVAGGLDALPLGPLRTDAYVQTGLVGVRRRDGFVDGAARIGREVGPVAIGVGAWGAAQPGLARLDIGPQAVIRLGGAAGFVTAALDWRLRVAGDARPGGGVALTLAGSF